MHCKSLWIKASAKCINVNVNDAQHFFFYFFFIFLFFFEVVGMSLVCAEQLKLPAVFLLVPEMILFSTEDN